MEQITTHSTPQPPESDALRSLYFLSHVNPEVGIEDLRGLNLAEAAVLFMEDAGLDIAPEYRERLQHRKYEAHCDQVETLIAENTHSSLTEAVYLASEELNLEQLSIAWYAREEYEATRELRVNKHGLVDEADAKQYLLDEFSITDRYTKVVELQIALELAMHGFEDTGPALLRHYQHRLALVDKAVRDATTSTIYGELARDLAHVEHKQLIACDVSDYQMLYYAHSTIRDCILTAKGVSESTKQAVTLQTVDFYEDVVENALSLSNGRVGRNMIFATRLMADLLEFDPDNKKYKKWQKRLGRHFGIHQYDLITRTYRHSDMEYALHNLGRPTISDTVVMMADASNLVGGKDYYRLP